jgi:hypothetical protein
MNILAECFPKSPIVFLPISVYEFALRAFFVSRRRLQQTIETVIEMSKLIDVNPHPPF